MGLLKGGEKGPQFLGKPPRDWRVTGTMELMGSRGQGLSTLDPWFVGRGPPALQPNHLRILVGTRQLRWGGCSHHNCQVTDGLDREGL